MPPLSLVEPACTRNLYIAEREDIAKSLGADKSIRQIAKELGRHPSTVLRELRRNMHHQQYRRRAGTGFPAQPPWNYSPHGAQLRADKNASRPKQAKLAANPRLREQVGDLIVGKESKSAIGTRVERMTGYVILLHLPEDHGALAVQDAMIGKMSQLPPMLRQTLTWDQGSEMANHAQIAAATNLELYFCNPRWRGSGPATKHQRSAAAVLPKGTDLSFWGPRYLDYVAAELNNRPRNASARARPLKPSISYCPTQPSVAMTA